MVTRENKEFELQGVNHLALVCKDMARAVDFYSNVLGMPVRSQYPSQLISLGFSESQ